MHPLPCAASGGEDGVCMALTKLSRELLDASTSGMQAGGCDSSDCLFCQYRSNSPFHLNAYAGKLTTLLRKRSLNGMTRSSLNSFIDTSSEQGAAFLAAATAALGSNAKRSRSSSLSGNATLYAATAAAPGASSSVAFGDEATDTVPHDCQTMCSSGQCQGDRSHYLSTVIPSSSARPAGIHTVSPLSTASGATPGDASARDAKAYSTHGATRAGSGEQVSHPHSVAPSTTGRSQGAALELPGDRSAAGEAGPGPSSALLLKRATSPSRRQAQPHHYPSGYHEQPRHRRDPSLQQRAAHPDRTESPHHRSSLQERPPAAAAAAATAAATTGQQQLHLEQLQGLQQQQQPRQLLGQPLPDGWVFQPGWERRQDPAPAELREVLALPDVASGCRPRASGGQGGSVGGPYGCQVSAGIVCALEFSPDGRLLAAGGVDKQIRLYNLSEVFGDMYDDEDDTDGIDELYAGTHGGGCGGMSPTPEEEPDGSGSLRRDSERTGPRRRCGPRTGRCDSDDDDDDLDPASRRGASAGGCGSLLAAVHRMPSKISSMAWSPFMDGVLTVGDYDGVLLQVHIASGHQCADVDAHGGRKIWSVAHSTRTPHLVASAADDRCARLWTGRGLAHCVATLQPNPRASVCSVDFSPGHDHLLALACSDRTAYLYDMRRLGAGAGGPLAVLRAHSRPASYCRFLGSEQLVTAATDASLALWDLRGAMPVVVAATTPAHTAEARAVSPFHIVQQYEHSLAQPAAPLPPTQLPNGSCGGSGLASAACVAAVSESTAGCTAAQPGPASRATSSSTPAAVLEEPRRVFRGHRNEKNFVGLSVRAADRLLACGSECSRAFAYHTSWSDPLATLDLPGAAASACPSTTAAATLQPLAAVPSSTLNSAGWGPLRRLSGGLGTGTAAAFVSAVCWQPAEAATMLGLPPLLASATSLGGVSLSVLAARP